MTAIRSFQRVAQASERAAAGTAPKVLARPPPQNRNHYRSRTIIRPHFVYRRLPLLLKRTCLQLRHTATLLYRKNRTWLLRNGRMGDRIRKGRNMAVSID